MGLALRRRRSKSRDSSTHSRHIKRDRLTTSSGTTADNHSSSMEEEDRDDDLDEELLVDRQHSRERERDHSQDSRSHMSVEGRDERTSSSVKQEDESGDGTGNGDCDDAEPERRIAGSNRRRSSSDPVNLSICRQDQDSDDGHVDVETIANAPSKVSRCQQSSSPRPLRQVN